MKKALKILGITAGIIISLLVILSLVISFVVPWDKVKDKITEKASVALKREVKIEKLNFSLFKGIELKGFYVGNTEGFAKGAFISADSAVVKYDFWALLRKQVKITKIELVKPYILIEKGKKDKYNFSDLMDLAENKVLDQTEKKTVAVPASSELPVELSISKFAISDGIVKYSDVTVKPAVEVEARKINISVAGLSLETVKPFTIKASAEVDYNKTPIELAVEGKMEIKFKEQIFKAENMTARLPGINATASVELANFMENPVFKLDAVTAVDLKKVMDLALAMADKDSKAMLAEMKLSGEAVTKFNIAGSMTKTAKGYDIKANGSGSEDLTKAEIKYSTNFIKPKSHPMVLSFKLDMAGEKLLLDADIKLKDSALKAKIDMAGFVAPKVSLTLDGEVGISEVYSFLPVMEGFEAAGKATLAGSMFVPVKKDYSVDYKGIKINIKGKVKDFGTQYSAFKYGVSKMNADLSLNEKILELTNLNFLTGTSPFSGSLSAANFNLETMTEWKTKFTGDVKFNLSSQKFLIDEIMNAMPEKKATATVGSSVATGGSKSAAKKAFDPESNFGLSNEEIKEYLVYVNPGLKVEGKASIKEMVYKKVKFTDMVTDVNLVSKAASVTSSINAYSGSIKNVIKVDMNVPGLAYETSADINGVQSGDLINAFIDSFFKPDIAKEIKDKVAGAAVATLNIKGVGCNKKDIKKNISGALDYKLVNGKLRNFKILGDALAALKVNRGDEIVIKEFAGKHKIVGQKVTVDLFKVTCDDIRYSIEPSGYVGFDKDMDSSIFVPFRIDVAPSAAAQMGDLGKFGANEDGWFPLDFDQSGTMSNPTLPPAMNLERSKKNLERELKKKATEELQKNSENIKKGAEKLLKGLFGK